MRMTRTDYKEKIQTLMIRMPSTKHAIDSVERCLQDAIHGCDHRSIAILGESGSGKSRILDYVTKKYPVEITDSKTHGLILYVRTISKPTVKGMVESMLVEIGDPISSKGTEYTKTNRLRKLIKEKGVVLIIIDEFQHFVDKAKSRVWAEVADWLKVLVDNTGVSLVVAGLPYGSAVIESNEQLIRRFKSPIFLPQYNWLNDVERNEYRGILKAYQKTLHGLSFPDLSDEDMAFRFYCATSGLIGRIANILKEVIDVIYDDGERKQIWLEDLSIAAQRANYKLPEGFDDPFSTEFMVSPKSEKEIVEEVMRAGVTRRAA